LQTFSGGTGPENASETQLNEAIVAMATHAKLYSSTITMLWLASPDVRL
jgi:hypothetical protein